MSSLNDQLNDVDAELFQLRSAAYEATCGRIRPQLGSLSERIASLELQQDSLRKRLADRDHAIDIELRWRKP